MNAARDHFLANPSLAEEKNGGIGGRDALGRFHRATPDDAPAKERLVISTAVGSFLKCLRVRLREMRIDPNGRSMRLV